MAMNPMQRKIRNSFLLGFLLAIIIGAVAVGLLFMKIKSLNEEHEALLESMRKQNVTVYALTADAKEGQTLAGNEKGEGSIVKQVTIPANAKPKNAITNLNDYMIQDVDEGDDGDENENQYKRMVAKVDLGEGTILTTDVVERDKALGTFRNVEYTMITLPSRLEEGDYIDIRMKYPTGEDLVVLSKMRVNSCSTNSVWLTLSEGQLLLLNNAIIESYMLEGTMIYATQYANAAQPALTTTYVPQSNVLTLISANGLSDIDQAILTADGSNRNFIEELLGQYDEEKRDKVIEGFEAEKTNIQAAREELLGDMGY